MLNNEPCIIAKNLAIFFRHMCLPQTERLLWVRELCINKRDRSEFDKNFKRCWQQLTENCSCGVLSTDLVMEALEDEGLLPRESFGLVLRSGTRTWTSVPIQDIIRPISSESFLLMPSISGQKRLCHICICHLTSWARKLES